MPNTNDSWGIEVGSNALKAIRLQREADNIVMVEHEIIEYPKVLSTPDVEPTEMIREALIAFGARHDLTQSTVVTSVAGNMAFARFAKLPPVEPKAVAGIVQYEAQQQIPFPIDQVEWDYQTFQFMDSPDVEVGIFAITKDRVGQFLASFHAAQVPVHKLSLSPVAVYNGIGYDQDYDEDTPGTILMDIGTNSTDVIIVEQGRLWLRTIPIGGHHFTEALVSNFKLNYSKAEKIKREAATSKYARQIFQAMRPVFVDLVNEVQRSLGFYQTLNRDAELKNLIGMGSTFQLPGLKKFLKQQLSLEVSKLESFSRIKPAGDASEFEENTVTLSPAYGLALQGLDMQKVSCNLLPMSLIRKQVWSAKKGYAAAAAAIIAVSSVLAYSRLWLDRQSYQSNTAERRETEKILKQAEQFAGQAKDAGVENDPRLKIENLRRTLDYRNVWPSILDDIATSLSAVQPQAELISQVDAEGKTLKVADRIARIKAIPRKERRLMNIELVDYKYNPGEVFKERDAIDAEEYLGGEGEFLEGVRGPARPPVGQPQPAEAEEDSGPPPPSFDIMITGTTTRDDAPKFLNESFIAALHKIEAEQKAGTRDKPYKITNVKLAEVVPMIGSPGFKAPVGGPGAIDPTGGRGFGTGDFDGGLEGEFLDPEGFPGGGRPVPGSGGRNLPGATPAPRAPAEATQPKAGVTFVDYMPSDPFLAEDRQTDWRFTITWRVELIRPEDARKAEKAAAQQKKMAKPNANVRPTGGTAPAGRTGGTR